MSGLVCVVTIKASEFIFYTWNDFYASLQASASELGIWFFFSVFNR